MKTNTLKSKKRLLPNKGYITALALFGYGICSAQVQNNSSLFVSDNANFYVASGAYNFGLSPAISQTSKTASTYGVLSFSATASTNGASNSHNVNGYVRTYGTSQFIFPIGTGSIYAPAAATPASPTGVDAAYFATNPSTLGPVLGIGVTKISSSEYWILKGATSKISLTWRAGSNVLSLTDGGLNNLTILGWNGTQWQIINSTFDTTSILGGASTFNVGSITSTANVSLTTYTAFALGKKVEPCSELIASNGTTKIWDGTAWSSGGAPTLENPVIITGNYSGNLSCNSLELRNATVTLTDGQLLEIVNGATATGSGKVIMSSQSSLVQRDGASPAPPIELTKTTRDARRYDYIYWGTPIAENIKPMLSNAIAVGESTADAFDLTYKYTSGLGGGWADYTATEVGRGFITRVKLQAPFLTQTDAKNINLKLTGIANNGNVSVGVVNNSSNPSSKTSYNLVANPYPSAINVDKFLLENTQIDGAVYLWTASTSSGSSNTVTSYTQADYAVYNTAGEVSPNASSPKIAGKIASAQGFMVKSLLNAGTVTFNNCMRLTEGNNNFFRNANTQEEVKDRFKLTMTSEGIYSQILIAYIDGATLGYDRLYDAARNSSSTSQLYSLLQPEGIKLAINGRPIFFDTDIVPLGVSQTTTDLLTYTINIDEKEGKFNNGEATVYLHDKTLQVYHDFANGPYVFSTNVLASNDRFEVVYHNTVLSNPNFNNTTVNALIKNQAFTATSSIGMNEIEIYDITGRKIISYNARNEKSSSKPFTHSEGVYIVKIKLENGSIATQKLINQK